MDKSENYNKKITSNSPLTGKTEKYDKEWKIFN